MEEAEREIQRKTPTGGSRVDTPGTFFNRGPASGMNINLDAEASRSSKGSSSASRPCRKGKGKTPGRPRRPAERHPHHCNPFVTCNDRDGRACPHSKSQRAARWECPEPVPEEASTPLPVRVQRVLHLPTAVGKASPADPCPDPDPDGGTWIPMMTSDSAQTPAHPTTEGPRMADRLDPHAEDCPEDRQEEEHLLDPKAGYPDRGPPGGPPDGDPPDGPRGVDIPENIWRWIVYLKRKICNLEREAQINKIEIGKSAAVAAKA